MNGHKGAASVRIGRVPVLAGVLAAVLLLLSGCGAGGETVPTCKVVFEDNPELFFYNQVYDTPRGGDVTATVGVPTGRRIDTVSFDRYTVSGKTGFSASYDYYTLILHDVRYPAVVRLTTSPALTTVYAPGEGQGETITVQEDSPRLSPNTLPWRGQFSREGFLAVGWNTAPDGSGVHIGFGSRSAREDGGETLTLYPEWLPCTPEEAFTWTERDGVAVITGYDGREGDLVIPETLGGLPVTSIAAGAFGNVTADIVALPSTLTAVEPGAFSALTAEHLYLFDTLEQVDEASFGAYTITRLHLNAVKDPTYSGTYFDTFPDKADYLRSVAEADKLVLFCGSSARFGYDSPMLAEAFPDYEVVNMGVYAYANMLPQARIVLHYMKEGDILLHSPELDAIEQQFCGSIALDKETFCMTESNYDLLSLLDCREFTNLFGAFGAFQAARMNMEPRSYHDSPAMYDEDGNRQEQATYNRYGDYILYRENNLSGENFGIKRAFYNAGHITQADWQGINAMYDSFASKGVSVYFTYSPRSRTSISEDSSEESIMELDTLFRQKLHAPVISNIQSSLMDPLYFYATDNHLSTEGAEIHTTQVIDDLRRTLEGEA